MSEIHPSEVKFARNIDAVYVRGVTVGYYEKHVLSVPTSRGIISRVRYTFYPFDGKGCPSQRLRVLLKPFAIEAYLRTQVNQVA